MRISFLRRAAKPAPRMPSHVLQVTWGTPSAILSTCLMLQNQPLDGGVWYRNDGGVELRLAVPAGATQLDVTIGPAPEVPPCR